jgi:hypothetical protein
LAIETELRDLIDKNFPPDDAHRIAVFAERMLAREDSRERIPAARRLGMVQSAADFFAVLPFVDMIIFGSCIAMAIYWRKKPEYHRRLVFVASCQLMDAAIGRFDFMFNHNLFYPALDCIIVLGMVRDWVVDKRVHKVYLYALPSLIVVQSLAIYAWRIKPNWWQGITQAIMGL